MRVETSKCCVRSEKSAKELMSEVNLCVFVQGIRKYYFEFIFGNLAQRKER